MLMIIGTVSKKGLIRGGTIMKQVVNLIRKADVEKEYVEVLHLELDYELASLYDAMERKDEIEMQKSKKRLKEIHKELEVLNGFAR